MKKRFLKIIAIVSIVLAATILSIDSKAENNPGGTSARPDGGTECLAYYTKTYTTIGFITYLRYDYYWCDGTHTWSSGWWL